MKSSAKSRPLRLIDVVGQLHCLVDDNVETSLSTSKA